MSRTLQGSEGHFLDASHAFPKDRIISQMGHNFMSVPARWKGFSQFSQISSPFIRTFDKFGRVNFQLIKSKRAAVEPLGLKIALQPELKAQKTEMRGEQKCRFFNRQQWLVMGEL
ncbi:MAG: hypothetical protein ACUVTP_00885 [Candidatus Fervidibacter sp.]|uniref:hypothetical protein n=1 Tax=Candidatus Fervidibacter sp. TaxID=3100871 RepID=UPI00404B9BA4